MSLRHLAEKLLLLIADERIAGELVDGLAEEHARRGAGADAWYLRQVAGSVLPLLSMRLRRSADFGVATAALVLAATIPAVLLHGVGDWVRAHVPYREGLVPMTSWLVLTLAVSVGLTGALAVVIGRGAAPLTARQALAAGALAGGAVIASFQLSVASFPPWYGAGFLLALPMAALLAVRHPQPQ